MDKIEIARSYSRKINLGNFENADFFCSAKLDDVNGADQEEQIETAMSLHQFCKKEVEKSIEEFLFYKKREELKKENGILVSVNDQKELKFANPKIDD